MLAQRPPSTAQHAPKTNRCRPALLWCRRGDLNPHALAGTSPSSWRVCQFRHSDVVSGLSRTAVNLPAPSLPAAGLGTGSARWKKP